MAPLGLAAKLIYLLVIAWSARGTPIHHTTEDHSLPRETKYDHTAVSRDIHTTVVSLDIEEEEEGVYNRLDHDVTLTNHNCSKDRDCYPEEYKNLTIPNNFIKCESKTCKCSDCFYNFSGRCAVKQCYHFDNDTQECIDDRKSQKTVFLLSIFLSSTGAANIYIEQYKLGAIQGGVLLLAILLCVCTCCAVKCCRCFEDECDCCDCCEDCWGCCYDYLAPTCILLTIITMILCFIVTVGWWAADIVIFTENTRLDGDGCPLKYDL